MGALQVENTDCGRSTLHKVSNDKGLKENEVWLDVIEVGTLFGVHKVHVRRNCKAKQYKTKLVYANGGKHNRIALSSLAKLRGFSVLGFNTPQLAQKSSFRPRQEPESMFKVLCFWMRISGFGMTSHTL